MKKITFVMAFIATTFMWQINAQTYTGAGNPQPIDPPVNVSSDATTSLTGNIGTNPGDYTIESVMLDITHTFDADVELTLVSPSGTTLDLSIANGSGGDNYTNTVFEDGGADITAASAPFTGVYEPEGGTFASTFDGEPMNGNWTLEVFDNFGGFDSGTLNSYSITFAQITIGNPPVISCVSDLMADTDPGECSAIVNFSEAIAQDAEDGTIATTQTAGPATGAMFPTGDTIVEFTATDSDGNTAVCQFTVTVTDMEAPEAVCQNLTLEVDPMTGSVSITPADIDNGSSDNCGIVSYALDVDTFTCSDTGENDVTLTVTDEEGNTSSCTATVTIEDNTAPEIVCIGQPATITDSTSDSPNADIPDNDTTGLTSTITITDDFEITDLNVDLDITHTWVGDLIVTITSPSGTSVTIVDRPGVPESSSVGCLGDNIMATLDDEATDPVEDQCENLPAIGGTFTPNNPLSAFDGESTIGDWTINITDNAGGDTGTLNTWALTYQYDVAPSPYPVELNSDGIATVSAEELIQTVNEACMVTYSFGGGAPVMETVTEAPGLAIEEATPIVSSTITIAEDLPISDLDVNLNIPHTWVGDLVIELESPSGTVVTLIDQPGAPPGTLGCSGDDIMATLDDEATDPAEGECEDLPAIGGTFTPNNPLSAFDGESTMGDWTLTVTDTFALADDGELTEWGLTYTSVPSATMDFDCSNLGENEVEVFVVDSSGNTSSCIATVDVSDVTAPVLVCNSETTVELGEDGTATIDPMALLATADTTYNAMVIGGDNGSFAEGRTDFTVEVTEAVTVSFDWSYTTDDTLAGFDSFGYTLNGTYNQLTDDAQLNQNGNGSVALEVGDTFGFRTLTDDNFGGGSTATVSNFMPGFTGQFDPANWNLQLTNSDGDAFFVEIPGGPLSFDACGIDVLAVDVTEVSCADIGTPITVTVFASDASGNIASCTSTVNVVDTLGPVVTCPEDQTVDPGGDNLFYEVPDYFATGEGSALDNCTDPVTITSQDPAPGELLSDDVYTVTLTAEDEYGNVGTCTFQLTVESELGVGENSLSNSISMYPNPAQNQVTISNRSNIALQNAVIYDINGKLINQYDLRNMQGEQVIDVSALASGVYVVQITSDKSSVSKRLIKE